LASVDDADKIASISIQDSITLIDDQDHQLTYRVTKLTDKTMHLSLAQDTIEADASDRHDDPEDNGEENFDDDIDGSNALSGFREEVNDRFDAIYDKLPAFMQNAYSWMNKAWSRSCKETKHAWQRAFRGYDDYALWNFGHSELLRISKLLETLSVTSHGYPMKYVYDPKADDADEHGSREYWLNKHDDDYDEWLTSRARTIHQLVHDSMDSKKTYDYHIWNETVADYGPAAAAWSQDLHHAAYVIKRYVDVLDDEDYVWYNDQKAHLDTQEHLQIVKDEFTRVWLWLGPLMLDIWD
jgi:hypothetical protein